MSSLHRPTQSELKCRQLQAAHAADSEDEEPLLMIDRENGAAVARSAGARTGAGTPTHTCKYNRIVVAIFF